MGCPVLFRCQLCLRVVPPGTRAHRVARETRETLYPVRKGVNRFVMKDGKVVKQKDPPNRPIGLDDPGGRGRISAHVNANQKECGVDVFPL